MRVREMPEACAPAKVGSGVDHHGTAALFHLATRRGKQPLMPDTTNFQHGIESQLPRREHTDGTYSLSLLARNLATFEIASNFIIEAPCHLMTFLTRFDPSARPKLGTRLDYAIRRSHYSQIASPEVPKHGSHPPNT